MPVYLNSRQSEEQAGQEHLMGASFGGSGITHYKNYRIPLLVAFVLLVACLVVLAALFDDPWTVSTP